MVRGWFALLIGVTIIYGALWVTDGVRGTLWERREKRLDKVVGLYLQGGCERFGNAPWCEEKDGLVILSGIDVYNHRFPSPIPRAFGIATPDGHVQWLLKTAAVAWVAPL